VLAGVLATRGDSGPAGLEGRLLRIDPAANHGTSSTPVGRGAAGVAVGSGRVWVASERAGTVSQLDLHSGAVTSEPAIGRPYDVTVYRGKAYVAALGPATFGGNVTEFDASGGGRIGGLTLPAPPCSLTSGSAGVWLAGCPDVYALGVDGSAVTPGVRVPIPYAEPLSAGNVREAPGGIAMGAGAVWVIGDADDRRLWRIDPSRHRIVATIPLGFPPGDVAAGAGAVWVTDELGDRLIEVDPATNRITRRIPVGRGAAGVAVGAGSVWVAGAIGHTVTRVDPASGRVAATIRVAASPHALAVGDGAVWVVGDAL
jgi:DNA-binding beta-propeller fold protein YncE